MIHPWWGRAEWLDSEIQSLMGESDLTVWMDSLHNCIHIMRGGEEFTSAMFPLDDSIRNDLRQQAYILHNGMTEDEINKVKYANEKLEQADENTKEDAKTDWRDEATWEYQHRFQGKDVTPMIIVPGEK